MSVDPNDPKLTAYALGELDEDERAQIEAQVAHSEELRRTVDEIRDTAKVLTEELQSEPVLSLTSDQRQVIEANAVEVDGGSTTTPGKRPLIFRRWWIPTALAASLLMISKLALGSKSRVASLINCTLA